MATKKKHLHLGKKQGKQSQATTSGKKEIGESRASAIGKKEENANYISAAIANTREIQKISHADALLQMQIEHDVRSAEHHFYRELSDALKKEKVGAEISSKILNWLNPSAHNQHFLSTSSLFLWEDAGGSEEARRTMKKLVAIKYMLGERGIHLEIDTKEEGEVPIIELKILQEKEEVLDNVIKDALDSGALEHHYAGSFEHHGAAQHHAEVAHEHHGAGTLEHHQHHVIGAHEHHLQEAHGHHIHDMKKEEEIIHADDGTIRKIEHENNGGEIKKSKIEMPEKTGAHFEKAREKRDIEKKVESIMHRQASPLIGSFANVVLESEADKERQEFSQTGIVQEKTEMGEPKAIMRKPRGEFEKSAFEFAQRCATKIAPQAKMIGEKHQVDAPLIFPQEEIRRWINEMILNAKRGGHTTFNSECNERMIGFYKEAAKEIMERFLENGMEMEIKFARDKEGKLAAKAEFSLPPNEIEKIISRKNAQG